MRTIALNVAAWVNIIAACLSPHQPAHISTAFFEFIEGAEPQKPSHSTGSTFPCYDGALAAALGQLVEVGACFNVHFDLGTSRGNLTVYNSASCELAVTHRTSSGRYYDSSKWQVTHGTEGRCPARSAKNVSHSLDCTLPGKYECTHIWHRCVPAKLVSSDEVIMCWACTKLEITGETGAETDSVAPIRNYWCHVSVAGNTDSVRATAKFIDGVFTQQSDQPSHSDGTTSRIPTRTLIWQYPFGDNGLPVSEALHRLANAAIVTQPTLLSTANPISS